MRVMILDEEKRNVEILKKFIVKNYNWSFQWYSTVFALVTAVYDEYKGDVELIIVHISEKSNNIDAARDLQAFFPHIKLIFYSESTAFAEDIFLSVPTFFLKLPFSDEWLGRAFDRAKTECDEDIGNTIIIHYKGHKQKIRYSSIKYIENMRRKLVLYTDNGMFETYMTFADIMSELPEQFIQCHRSYIINTDRIKEYSSDGIVLFSQEFVPISRSYHNQFKNLLG